MQGEGNVMASGGGDLVDGGRLEYGLMDSSMGGMSFRDLHLLG